MSLTGNLLAVFEITSSELRITTSGTGGVTSEDTRFRVVFLGSREAANDESGAVLGQWPTTATDDSAARTTGFNPADDLAEVILAIPESDVPNDAAFFEVQQYTSSSTTDTWATIAALDRPSNGRSAPIPFEAVLPVVIDAVWNSQESRWDFPIFGQFLERGYSGRGHLFVHDGKLWVVIVGGDGQNLIPLLENADFAIRNPDGLVFVEVGSLGARNTGDGEPYQIADSNNLVNDVGAISGNIQLAFAETSQADLSATITVDNLDARVGDTVTWSCAVGGSVTGPISYQWQRFSVGRWQSLNAPVGTRATLSELDDYADGFLIFRCIVTRGGLRATSAGYTVNWRARDAQAGTIFIANPISTLGRGETHQFRATPRGGRYDFLDRHWRIVPSATPATDGTIVADGDDGGLYTPSPDLTGADKDVTVEVTATFEGRNRNALLGTSGVAKASDTFNVKHIPTIVAHIIVDNYKPVYGDTVRFSVVTGGTATGPITYAWWEFINGAWRNYNHGDSHLELRGGDGRVVPESFQFRVIVMREGVMITTEPFELRWHGADFYPQHNDFGAFGDRKLSGGAFRGRKLSGGAFRGQKFST